MASAARLAAAGFLFCLTFCLTMSAADATGIWMGQIAGRNNEMQYISFEFKPGKDSPTGVMFGDEFDVPVQELKLSGDRISFFVTTTNYYDGRRTKFVFSGTVTGPRMELTRERAAGDVDVNPAKRQDAKQTFTLIKLS
ncbi:MAG: hypothetical protein M3Z09_18470 [Acidobacteriota bacterium]|nr:hypothetical protein [Acidobacteriota bacterium]